MFIYSSSVVKLLECQSRSQRNQQSEDIHRQSQKLQLSLAMKILNLYQIFSGLFVLCITEAQGYTVLSHWALNGTENGITLHGGPTFVEGRYPGSKAINFDQPSNCFARIPKVELRGRSFTIALWVKFTELPVNATQSIFGDWSKPLNFLLRLQTSELSFVRQKANASQWTVFKLTTPISNKRNKWFHVAVTWDQGMGLVQLYIDAKEVSSGFFDTNATWFPPNEWFEIGADTYEVLPKRQFIGSVMELYILDEPLSRSQIKYLKGFIEFDNLPSNKIVYVNETVRCQAIGTPTPYVAWVRSGVVLVNKTSTADITITNKSAEYKCMAKNREGVKTAVFKVSEAALYLCANNKILGGKPRGVNNHDVFTSSHNDRNLAYNKWHRILSPDGNQLPTTCVPQNRCGTQAPGWLNGSHPSVQDGIVQRTVCFHFNGDCCYHNTTVHIRKCFGYYVYKFSQSSTNVSFRYCVDNKAISNRDIPDSIFKDVTGIRLSGHVIYTDSSTDNHYNCTSLCLLHKSCKSFNYSKEGKICELNDATHREFSNSTETNHAFVYYEKLLVTAMKFD